MFLRGGVGFPFRSDEQSGLTTDRSQKSRSRASDVRLDFELNACRIVGFDGLSCGSCPSDQIRMKF